MAIETIFQHELATGFIYPFFLIFLIVFAILEKTSVLGKNKQVNAMVSFFIGLVFISAFKPKIIVADLILFLTIALVVMFVALMLWGFLMNGKSLDIFDNASPGLKWMFGIIIVVAVAAAVVSVTGLSSSFFDFLFGSSWSKAFWTNAIFVVSIAAVLALLLKTKS
jgi:hypothetical protein